MAEGGITLLSMTASDAEDPQTLRMVAGAIANLCGNGTFCCFVASHLLMLIYVKKYNFSYQIDTIEIVTSSW